MPPILALGAILLLASCAGPGPFVYVPDFAGQDGLAAFDYTDPSVWRIVADGPGPALELTGAPAWRPPHRSPLGLAILKMPDVGDFTLQVRARQTGREYPHRDLVFVFGWRDPAHFCYAHLASAADETAHHIHVVDAADRRPLTTARSQGVAWGDGWHLVRIDRRGEVVQVFFDDSSEPVLAAVVPRWSGRLGLGSFDDTGRFMDLRITALP